MILAAKVLTVSDGVHHGVREDASGTALQELLLSAGWQVAEHRVVADGVESVAAALIDMCQDFAGLVVTTGGTGFGPRDLTPEGTRSVLEREAPGLAEAARLVNPAPGRLSRGVAGTRGMASGAARSRFGARGRWRGRGTPRGCATRPRASRWSPCGGGG